MGSIWSQKGATLSDKSARQEFSLTQEEIIAAIRAGKLQFRENNMHGNPWFRLLRHEVEALVTEKGGQDHLQKKKLQKELADLNKEARKLKTRLKSIERRRAVLMKEVDAPPSTGDSPSTGSSVSIGVEAVGASSTVRYVVAVEPKYESDPPKVAIIM